MARPNRRVVFGAVTAISVAAALASALAQPVIAPPHVPNVEAGFHLEGAAEIDLVFGDIDAFKHRIDELYALDLRMAAARRAFSDQVHAAIEALGSKRRGCATEALALPYFLAHSQAAAHRAIGEQLELEYQAIRKLDRLGESYGLTPEYRSKVNRSRGIYEAALVDYREMRVAFSGQLAYAARLRGCNTTTLLEKGAAGVTAKIPAPPAHVAKADTTAQREPIIARPVTFFIDNRLCPTAHRVYIDGVLMGEIIASAKAAFQTATGRHALCLVPATSNAKCGDTGTLRTAYIHDGWSISMHCQAPPLVISSLQ